MEVERRYFDSKVECRAEGDSKKIVGMAAMFNSLSENLGGFREKIAPGAFDAVLADDVRALFNHDSNLILGRTTAGTLRLSVTGEGLAYEIDPPDTQVARDLLVSLQRKDVTGSSFAFNVEDDKWEEDADGRVVRTIIKFKRLLDVSPVTYPAYPETGVAMRSLENYQKQKTSAPTEKKSAHKEKTRLVELNFPVC